jgi:hypothetical protein
VPGARAVMQAAGERLAKLGPLPPGPEPGSGVSWVVAEAFDTAGERLACVELSGREPYTLTAGIIAWAAQQEVAATGALGPVQAFGVQALEDGCRQAGLERVSA